MLNTHKLNLNTVVLLLWLLVAIKCLSAENCPIKIQVHGNQDNKEETYSYVDKTIFETCPSPVRQTKQLNRSSAKYLFLLFGFLFSSSIFLGTFSSPDIKWTQSNRREAREILQTAGGKPIFTNPNKSLLVCCFHGSLNFLQQLVSC